MTVYGPTHVPTKCDAYPFIRDISAKVRPLILSLGVMVTINAPVTHVLTVVNVSTGGVVSDGPVTIYGPTTTPVCT